MTLCRCGHSLASHGYDTPTICMRKGCWCQEYSPPASAHRQAVRDLSRFAENLDAQGRYAEVTDIHNQARDLAVAIDAEEMAQFSVSPLHGAMLIACEVDHA